MNDNHHARNKLARYVIVGGLTAAVYFIAGALFHHVIFYSVPVSINIAFVLAVVVNYFLHYHFTFRMQRGHHIVVPKFLLMIGGGAVINWLLGSYSYPVDIPILILQMLIMIIIVIWNLVVSYLWVFRH